MFSSLSSHWGSNSDFNRGKGAGVILSNTRSICQSATEGANVLHLKHKGYFCAFSKDLRDLRGIKSSFVLWVTMV